MAKPFAIAPSPWGLSWPWEHACGHALALAMFYRGYLVHQRVVFSNEGFFQSRFFFSLMPACLYLALAACLWGLLCPSHLPMGATLTLVACLSHGGLAHRSCIVLGCTHFPWLLPCEVVMALRACTWALGLFKDILAPTKSV